MDLLGSHVLQIMRCDANVCVVFCSVVEYIKDLVPDILVSAVCLPGWSCAASGCATVVERLKTKLFNTLNRNSSTRQKSESMDADVDVNSSQSVMTIVYIMLSSV